MIWFDPTASFKRHFEPRDDGYIYYPKAKSGGKLISQEEFDSLIAYHRRWNGSRFRPGLLGCALLALCFILALAFAMFDLSEAIIQWATYLLVTAFLAAHIWIEYAPYRLYRNRPDSTPPRSKQDTKRAARAMLPWSITVWIAVIFGLLSYLTIVVAIEVQSIGAIALALLFSVGFIQMIRMAIQKFRDSRN